MSTEQQSSGPAPTMSRSENTKTAVSSAEGVSPVTTPCSPPASPEFGSSISRAQTFPFNFHSMRSKSPRPAPGPVQDQQPANLHQGTSALSNAQKQGKRTVSVPSVLPSSPSSPTRPSATSPSVSSTSHYGRHANEWLFGSFSVRKAVKGVWKGHEGKEK